MLRNGGFHSTGSKRCAPRPCRVLRENTGASGEDDFPVNRLRPDLARPERVRATFACGMESAVPHVLSVLSACRALAAPADVYQSTAVPRADE